MCSTPHGIFWNESKTQRGREGEKEQFEMRVEKVLIVATIAVAIWAD